jgi:hypothetical protein
MLDKLVYKEDAYTKEFFSASDFGKSNLDLYLRMTGVTPTNPPTWRDHLRMAAGNGVEESLVKTLKDSGLVWEHYMQEWDGRMNFVREGLEIHGYVDAMTWHNTYGIEEGVPIEIKSINNKNAQDISKYGSGKPRENYVGQLAIYMDSLGKDIGYLFVAAIDGLNSFWFECHKIAPGVYQCADTIVNINEEYKRWAHLKTEFIDKGIMPSVWEKRYKFPLDEIDWTSLSGSKISNARNGHAVIGDWEVLYSPYKNLIIELQGATLGYSEEEIAFIKDKTQGYTTWKNKQQ